MPIKTMQFGKHENVLWLEFGTGDIEFTKSREADEEFESLMFFKQHDVPHEIGEESDYYIGKTTDEVDGIKMVLKFKKPESITALVHSLTELQKQVSLSNVEQGVKECDATMLNSNSSAKEQKIKSLEKEAPTDVEGLAKEVLDRAYLEFKSAWSLKPIDPKWREVAISAMVEMYKLGNQK